ncbi:hypothetical protein MJT46_011062 [Ovis ammon polii x Ovis aries]|nr:hypothetical protein MJT46_011062 [Ovis ammon polii x Ovis aries]
MCAGPSCFLSSGDRCDVNAGNAFPTKQGKDPSSRATRRKRGSSGCGRDPRSSSRMETCENVLDFLKLWLMLSSYDGDERDRLWWPQDWNAQDSLLNKQRKDPSSRPTRQKRSSSGCGLDPHASSRVERGENVLDFLKLWLMLSSYDGDERDRLWWPQDWNAQDSLLNKQRKDPSSRPTRQKRSSSGCGLDPHASSRVERGENVLDFLKLWLMLSSYDGDERDRLWWPQDWNAQDSLLNKQRKDPSSRPTRQKRSSSGCGLDPHASSRVERGENVLDFLKLWLMLSSYDGDERDRLWWPQDWNAQDSLLNKQRKDPSSRPTRQKRSSSGCGLDPHASSRVERGLSNVHTWWESILGFNVKAVQGKQVPLEWTDTSGDSWNGGTTLEFLSPYLWRAPPLEMRRERQEFFPYETEKGSLISS